MALVFTAAAHDSPWHVVENLTATMKKKGVTPELLYRRATEYRTLAKLDLAAADLEEAIRRDGDHLPARTELARLLLARKDLDAALAMANAALEKAKTKNEQAVVRIVRGDIHAAAERPEQALADFQWACQHRPGEVDWHLRRSQLQHRLGLHQERVAGLAEGYERTRSAVLKIERLEAMIDAGQADAALAEIETELAEVRFKSSWLLRRARALRSLNRQGEAAADLRQAIAEIDRRLHPRRPDVTLLLDRGLAYALLGELDRARNDLAAAKKMKADPRLAFRLESLLAQEPSPELSPGLIAQ